MRTRRERGWCGDPPERGSPHRERRLQRPGGGGIGPPAERRRHRVERRRSVDDLVGDEGLLDPDPVDRRLHDRGAVRANGDLAGAQDDHNGGALEHGWLQSHSAHDGQTPQPERPDEC